ncbi:MAG: SDR family oxidoreductase [Bacteroidota bacterium]
MSKTVLITGSTDGVGKATAEQLANAGHEVIIHSRSNKKGDLVEHEIRQKTGNDKVTFVTADFTRLSEVSEMVSELRKRVPKIDVLINNAGVYRTQKNILPNGLEETFMVNHLAHFYLTLQLLPLIKESKQGRIINVSSMIHASAIDFDNLQGERWFDGSDAYSLSKLCNLLFTNKLASNLNRTNITVNALHPGVINTKLLAAGWGPFGENTGRAGERLFYLATNNELATVTGKYFVNNRQTPPAPVANRQEIMEKLWEISTALISQQGF